MCFSATASFTTAAVTAVAGGAALRMARPSYRPLAAVPLLFAIHQFAEGIEWLAASDPGWDAWRGPAIAVYLGVSKVVWVVWVPLAMLALETRPGRRRLMTVLVVLGSILAPALAYGLGAWPVTASVGAPHIQYRQDTPLLFRWFSDISYPLTVVLPPLLSSTSMVRLIGVLLFASLVLTKIFFYSWFASVWCFFAAFISVLVIFAVRTDPTPALAHSAPERA